MSDQTVGLPARKSRWSRTRALGRKWLHDFELRPASAWAVVSVLGLVLARCFWLDEGSLSNILFTAAVTGALVGFVVHDLSGRVSASGSDTDAIERRMLSVVQTAYTLLRTNRIAKKP